MAERVRELLPAKKTLNPRRIAARPFVWAILERTWCLGASEEEARAALKVESKRLGYSSGWEFLAWWSEARDYTGWLTAAAKRAEASDARREAARAVSAPRASLGIEPFSQARSDRELFDGAPGPELAGGAP